MEFVINHRVKFNSLDGTLFCLDNSMDMVTLARVTNDLLQLLINSNGIPISREMLLNELWEKRGLSASSNNLNNYVSMLRKALAQVGCPDLITTIPKHGFLFSAEVVTVNGDQSPSKLLLLSGDGLSPSASSPPVLAISTTIRHRKKMIIATVLTMLAIALSPRIYDYFRLKAVRTAVLAIQQCHFYLADDKTRNTDRVSTLGNIKAITHNEKLNCEQKSDVYYFADKKLDASGRVIVSYLLSYCPDKGNAPCENHYSYEFESKGKNEN
ncbi:TPA: transcriptional regulator [Serratia fonticola]